MALMCAKSDIKRDTEMKSMRQVAVGLNGAAINNQRCNGLISTCRSHDPYSRQRPVSTRIGQAGYGFGPYNLRPVRMPIMGLTVRCRHPYKPGRTTVLYGTARSPTFHLATAVSQTLVPYHPATVGLLVLMDGHCATTGFQMPAADRLATVELLALVAYHLATAVFLFPTLVDGQCATAGFPTLAANQ
jgi:hypothetical protein